MDYEDPSRENDVPSFSLVSSSGVYNRTLTVRVRSLKWIFLAIALN